VRSTYCTSGARLQAVIPPQPDLARQLARLLHPTRVPDLSLRGALKLIQQKQIDAPQARRLDGAGSRSICEALPPSWGLSFVPSGASIGETLHKRIANLEEEGATLRASLNLARHRPMMASTFRRSYSGRLCDHDDARPKLNRSRANGGVLTTQHDAEWRPRVASRGRFGDPGGTACVWDVLTAIVA
jgi:hypothetical protein